MGLPMLLLVSFFIGLAFGQYDHLPTPVPILKQINKHNEDGSYSYGYEAGDGSYKIESKYPTGEVYGKYGFVDDTGSVREVEYGASKRGFEPIGPGINVPPPTLTGNSIATAAGSNEPEDDGQYREDPSVYYTDPRYTNGERYETVHKARYPQDQPQYIQPRIPAPTQAYKSTSRYNTPVKYPQALVQAQYQPQYRTSHFSSPYEGQLEPEQRSIRQNPHSSANIALKTGLTSYTVHYRR